MPFFRYFFLLVFMAALLVIGWAGFRGAHSERPPLIVLPDMDDQAKVKYQAASEFFSDGKGGRQPVPGTMPMGLSIPEKPAAEANQGAQPYGFTVGTDYYHTGRFGDYWGDGIPSQLALEPALIRRGAERFNIYCAPCHGHAGDGAGVTAKYGITMANGNFHSPALSDPQDANYRTDGNIFNTITYGTGLMGPYGALIPVSDRWAIVAYIRTLQLAKTAAAAPAAQ